MPSPQSPDPTPPLPSPDHGEGNPAASIAVLCIDDNVLLGKALGRCIEGEPGFRWLGAIADGDAAVAEAVRLNPDVILMDIDMPGFDTFKMVEQLGDALPRVRVIMLSGHVDREYLKRSLDSGAWGYLSKAEETGVLIEGIRSVHRGEIALGKEIHALQRSTDLT